MEVSLPAEVLENIDTLIADVLAPQHLAIKVSKERDGKRWQEVQTWQAVNKGHLDRNTPWEHLCQCEARMTLIQLVLEVS